jgi:hypothetical protein
MKTPRRESVVDNENPLKSLKFFSKQPPKAFLHISERKQTLLHSDLAIIKATTIKATEVKILVINLR